MKAIKYLGLTLLLAGCTSPQPKDYSGQSEGINRPN